jgi:hypothetical protein
MRRRSYLRLATASVVGLGGCTAIAGFDTPGTDDPSTPDCPDRLAGTRAVCPQQDDGPLTVERTGGTVSSDRWSLAVIVTNRASTAYQFAPDGWTVFRRTDGEWAPAVPAGAVDRRRVELAPGDHYAWGLTTGGPITADVDQRVTIDLDPGRFGLVVPFRGPERVVAVAPFTVDG